MIGTQRVKVSRDAPHCKPAELGFYISRGLPKRSYGGFGGWRVQGVTSLPTDYFVCHDRLQDSNYPNKFGLWAADITSEPEEQHLDSTGEPYWLSVKIL